MGRRDSASEPQARLVERSLSLARTFIEGLPHVTESTSWGNPTFKLNRKAFIVFDHYKGAPCVWFRCPADRRVQLLSRGGYFPAPYDKKDAALCRALPDLDAGELEEILRLAYETALAP